ncbi:MAG: hypothetical protein PVG19_02915 [Desulfobacterales bacterium]|jgi:hypothetical protein
MISFVIIVENLQSGWIAYVKAMDRMLIQSELRHEIIIVANGTGKINASRLEELKELRKRLRIFDFKARSSRAYCLRAISEKTRGEWLIISAAHQALTDRSYYQLLDQISPHVDVVVPYRQKRGQRYPVGVYPMLFNWLVSRLTGNHFRDMTCPLKLCRREILFEIEMFGDVLSFLPIFATAKGFSVKEFPVESSSGKSIGRLFYKPSEYLTRLIEIFSLFFNSHFSRKPLRFFSGVGALFSFAGSIVFGYLLLQRFLFDIYIGNRPLLIGALLMIALGILVASTGLLGEIIVFLNRRRFREYAVDEKIPKSLSPK